MIMNASEKALKRKLIEKRKIVKHKLDLLKQNEVEHEDMFSPITKHLKKIETKLVQPPPAPPPTASSTAEAPVDFEKTERETEQEEEEGNDYEIPLNSFKEDGYHWRNIQSTPFTSSGKRQQHQFIHSTPHSSLLNINGDDDDVDDDDDNEDGIKQSIIENISGEEREHQEKLQSQYERSRKEDLLNASIQEYLEQYRPLPRRYIRGLIEDKNKKQFDHKYGVVYNPETEKFYIGDSELHIKDSDIVVKSKKYKGTTGLYELLFKKHPRDYTQEDENNYRSIILKTNAHRRNNKSTEQVQGSVLPKYKTVIAPYIGEGINNKHTAAAAATALTKSRKLFMQYSSKPIEYVYWDDPNELVDRLRLLTASGSAGNTNHINEINSIIEELREANIIE